jgi:hypothetical protein
MLRVILAQLEACERLLEYVVDDKETVKSEITELKMVAW